MRAFAWFLGAILLAGLIGGLLAYPAYEASLSFADWAFHRVASRVAMLVLLIELVWVCRHLRLTAARDFGYGLPWRRFIKVSLMWGMAGVASAGVGAWFLLSTHLRSMDPHFTPGVLSFARIFAVGLGSGIAVALIEETVMRGAMHTAIERESGPGAPLCSRLPCSPRCISLQRRGLLRRISIGAADSTCWCAHLRLGPTPRWCSTRFFRGWRSD